MFIFQSEINLLDKMLEMTALMFHVKRMCIAKKDLIESMKIVFEEKIVTTINQMNVKILMHFIILVDLLVNRNVAKN